MFEDIFNVKDIDPSGKQFDRGMHLLLFNVQCYFITSHFGLSELVT